MSASNNLHLQSTFPPSATTNNNHDNRFPNPSSPTLSTGSTNIDTTPASPIASDTGTHNDPPLLTRAPTIIRGSAPRAVLVPAPAEAGVTKKVMRGVGNWWLDPLAMYGDWFGVTPSQRGGPRSRAGALPRHVRDGEEE